MNKKFINKVIIINRNLLNILLSFNVLFFFSLLIVLITITFVIIPLITKRLKYSALTILIKLIFNNKGKKALFKILILLLNLLIIKPSGFFKGGNLGISFNFLFYFLLYLISF